MISNVHICSHGHQDYGHENVRLSVRNPTKMGDALWYIKMLEIPRIVEVWWKSSADSPSQWKVVTKKSSSLLAYFRKIQSSHRMTILGHVSLFHWQPQPVAVQFIASGPLKHLVTATVKALCATALHYELGLDCWSHPCWLEIKNPRVGWRILIHVLSMIYSLSSLPR